MNHYNPEEFEIVGHFSDCIGENFIQGSPVYVDEKHKCSICAVLNGKRQYAKIIIKHRGDKNNKCERIALESFREITKRQKEHEARLVEIASVKKHIKNYSKTKDTYAEYRKSDYSEKFFEEHREEITLHKAAKEAFSKIKGPIPKIKELNEEYEKVLREKKKTYAEYREAKQNMKDYQTAKYNVDQFLRMHEEEKRAKQKEKENKVL